VLRVCVSICALLLTSCANSPSQLSGTLEFSDVRPCESTLGTQGSVESGSGEILGSISIVRVERDGKEEGFPKCLVRLEAEEIDLDVDVLVIKFDDWVNPPARWILQKSEFENGEIQLSHR
jgi:hypothetical protein